MENYQSNLIYKELSYKIVGLLYDTHNELGRYCNEKQYGDKFEELLKANSIGYQREFILAPSFLSEMKGRNKVDFIVDNKIILEFKNKKLGIIVNFHQQNLMPKRILNSDKIDD